MFKKIQAFLIPLVLIISILFLTVRGAQAAAQLATKASISEDPLFELARMLWVAIDKGEFISIAVTSLVMFSALLARFGVRLTSWFGTGAGKAVITLLVTFSGGLSAALATNTEITWEILRTVSIFALATAGGYSLIKVLIVEPLTPWMQNRAAWIRSVWRALTWVYDRLVPPSPSPLPLSKNARQRAATLPSTIE